MAEHAARYSRLAGVLTEAGYDVVAPDLRGHGRTAATSDELGFFADTDGWNKAVGDISALTAIMRDESPGLPIVLLGHSMGSFMAQQLMIERSSDYAGVVLSGSNGPVGARRAVGAFIARLEVLRCGAKKPNKLLAAMSFGAYNKPFEPARTKFEWLSRDEAEVDKYVADPLCGFAVGAGLWRDMLAALGKLHRRRDVSRITRDLPVFVMSGTEDPVGGYGKGVQKLLDLYAGAGLTNVGHKFYDGARHEIFNETNRDEVSADLIDWLSEILPVL
jgi:alpha-beta hydrolase superfamily lysophospholipase